MKSVTDEAHRRIAEVVCNGDVAIDATVGNGYDCQFLAELVGDSDKVYGFDLQEAAIESSRSRLQAAGLLSQVSLHLVDHAQMEGMVLESDQKKIAAAVFNLGYLPGSDKTIITQSPSTIAALESAAQLLRAEGLVSVTLYWGHQGGAEESEAVLQWAESLSLEHWEIEHWQLSDTKKPAPSLLALTKKQPAAEES